MAVEDPCTLIRTISGSDVILAYGYSPTLYGDNRAMIKYFPFWRNSCLFWSRYLYFVINFFIGVGGAFLIGLSSWALDQSSGLALFKTQLDDPSCLLLTCGLAMVAVGVCGCGGALRLNEFFLRLYIGLVAVLFALQIILGVILYASLGNIETGMTHVMTSLMDEYIQDSGRLQDVGIDFLQSEHKCCGATDYRDWERSREFSCNSSGLANCGVPNTCCKMSIDVHCGYGIRDLPEVDAEYYANINGCVAALMGIFKRNVVVIAAIAFCVTFVQMCAACLAYFVMGKVEKYNKNILRVS